MANCGFKAGKNCIWGPPRKADGSYTRIKACSKHKGTKQSMAQVNKNAYRRMWEKARRLAGIKPVAKKAKAKAKAKGGSK